MKVSLHDVARHGNFEGSERLADGVIFQIFVPNDELEDIGGYEE